MDGSTCCSDDLCCIQHDITESSITIVSVDDVTGAITIEVVPGVENYFSPNYDYYDVTDTSLDTMCFD